MILGELNKLFHGFCVDFTEKKVGFTENKYLVETFARLLLEAKTKIGLHLHLSKRVLITTKTTFIFANL